MEKVAVTAICSVGVALACAVVVLWRGTCAHEVSGAAGVGPDRPVRARAAEGLRLAAAVSAAGVGGGLLTFGLGGRLMMRVLAATSPSAQGLLTDAEERVGEVSVDGTVGLVAFLAIFSALPAGVFVLSRRRFPRRSIPAGLLAGGIGGGLLARMVGLVDPTNRDFDILEPTWLAVLLCVALIALGSMTIAVLADRFVANWPYPALSARGVAGLLPLVVYLIPPLAVVGLVLVASRVFVLRPQRFPLVAAVGSWLTILAGVAGGGWVLINATEILL